MTESGTQKSAAEQALISQYGGRITIDAALSYGPENATGSQTAFYVELNDSSITLDELNTAITNATGVYSQGTAVQGPQQAGTSFDMGAFLNSIGQKIRNLFSGWNLPSWWVWVLAIFAILFGIIFLNAFGQGIGRGFAEKV